MSKPDNKRFDFMCSLLSDYIRTYFKLPTATTVFRNEKLGCWFRNQINVDKKGTLSDVRKIMLSNVFRKWNGTSDEIKIEMLEVFNYEWKHNIKPSVKEIPIDTLLSGEHLLHAVQNGYFTARDLFDCPNIPLSYGVTRKEIISVMMPWIHPEYIKLVYAVMGRIDDIDLLHGVLSKTPEEMAEKIDSVILTLSEREQFVLKERFFNHKTLEDLTSSLGVNRERVRQIEIKALRKLRHPSRYKQFIAFNRIEAVLYRSGISKEQAVILFDNGFLNSEYEGLVKKWKSELNKKDETITSTITVYSSIDELHFSVRAYNCIRRKRIETVGELINVMKFPEEVRLIRNLGKATAKEIYNILIDLFPHETELVDAKREFE